MSAALDSVTIASSRSAARSSPAPRRTIAPPASSPAGVADEPGQLVVVVSAEHGVTDALLEIAAA